MGACAISGGPFKEGYNVLKGIDRYIPDRQDAVTFAKVLRVRASLPVAGDRPWDFPYDLHARERNIQKGCFRDRPMFQADHPRQPVTQCRPAGCLFQITPRTRARGSRIIVLQMISKMRMERRNEGGMDCNFATKSPSLHHRKRSNSQFPDESDTFSSVGRRNSQIRHSKLKD
jgi:hypothetical protein